MNASNSFPATKPWMLQSDTNKYPILLAYQNNKFERFAPMLSQVKLGGDKIADVKRFYNNINVVMMTTLSSMHFLPEYKALTDTFDPVTHILPPTLHTQYEDAVNAYKQYGRALLLHLQNETTIMTRTAPRAAIIQQEQSMHSQEKALLL